MTFSTPRLLFILTLIWAASIFWIAPRPPMADLPQHAGQVALLRDLLSGTSPWADIFRLNFFTPYLVGYGLALPLSFIVPAGVALKVILTLAYVAFVISLIQLRKHFGGDPRLDWLFLLSFFGPAYGWGFVTFLTAAPVALFFILVADVYAQRPTAARGVATAVMGFALLLSHGLMFVFGMVVAGGLYVIRRREDRMFSGKWLLRTWPFVIAGLVCVVYFLISKRMEEQYGSLSNAGPFLWRLEWKRLPKIFINSLDGDSSLPVVLTSTVLALAPWVLGLRIDFKRPQAWVLFAVSLLIAVLVPLFALATGILYLRFALFTLPAYALMFTKRVAHPASSPGPLRRLQAWLARARPAVVPAMVATTWLMLGVHSWHAWRFAQESRDFESVLAAMKPGQRALWLPIDRASPAARNEYAYLHYGAWYQSEKQGLVDFNFAWFPPQIARFKPEKLPAVSYGFEHTPENFDWQRHHADQYRYFVVRHLQALPADIFRGAVCQPVKLLDSGAWTLFERRDCRAAAAALPAAH